MSAQATASASVYCPRAEVSDMPGIESNRPDETGVILEQGKRLSESLLWRLQRKFFDSVGAQAWTEGIVPHYITGNAWIADAYAKVVLGWRRDCAGTGAREPGSFPPLDLRHPVTLLELGCGSGRVGVLFFAPLPPPPPPPPPPP